MCLYLEAFLERLEANLSGVTLNQQHLASLFFMILVMTSLSPQSFCQLKPTIYTLMS